MPPSRPPRIKHDTSQQEMCLLVLHGDKPLAHSVAHHSGGYKAEDMKIPQVNILSPSNRLGLSVHKKISFYQ